MDDPFNEPFWKILVGNFGANSPFILVILVAIWRIARWASPRIDRLVDNHIEFTKSIESKQDKIYDAIIASSNTEAMKLDKIAAKLDQSNINTQK